MVGAQEDFASLGQPMATTMPPALASHQSGSEQGTGSIATKTSSFRTLEHVCNG